AGRDDRAGPWVASSDAARAPHRRDARRHAAALAPAQCRHGDARGLEVSPGGLLQNELVQRQIRDGLAQPAVLELKVLQALHLLGFQPAELLAPPIIRHLAHPDLADCVRYVLALRDQNIDLPQLRNDLFRLVTLPCHCSPPRCQRHTSSRTTSMGADHYQRLSIDWDAANPMRNGDWGQIIPPKKGRAVARKSKNPKHPAVKREEEEDWGK